jgi:hypothetical protein
MAAGYELSLDIDVSALKQADKTIKDMVTHSRELKETMHNLLGNIDTKALGMALGKMQDYFKKLSDSKVSPDVDTSKMEHLYDVIEKIVRSISNISKEAKDKVDFEFFDTSKIYYTSDGLWAVEKNIARIKEELKKTKKEWEGAFDIDKTKFQPPINPRTGKAFGTNTNRYKDAYAEWEKAENERLAIDGEKERKRLEIKRKALQEELKEAQTQAAFLRKTASEQADYVIAEAKRETREVQQEIKARQSEYAKTLAEMRKRQNEIANLEKGNATGQNDAQIHGLENRYILLNEKRKQLEQDYGQFLVAIAEKHNADILAIEAKRIKAKRQLEEELRQKELETPQGALMSANNAKTIDEMKQAQKNVLAARNKTDVNDTQTIQDLNKAYINLRANIEDLTKAEKNEQSLQPTLRNEYARLIRELDKLQEAQKDWRKTSRFQEGDAEAKKALEDLIKREQDVQARINDIRAGAGNKLDQEDRRFAAEKAQRELAETERLEAQKNAIRQKYRTIDADTANSVLQDASQSKNVVQAEKAIENLKDAIRHLNTEDEKYEQTLESLNKEIEKHTHEIKKATDASYRDKDKYGTYDGALKYKEEARTLKDQIKAIEYLKIARQNLDRVALGESEYKRQMEKLNKEIRRSQREVNKLQEDFKNFNSKAGDLVGQLSRRMAILFSVSAIEGYVQKIASIRGEFEIQQRSLQVLIGSQEEANKIWEQTVALAVKSPFRVKELVTYTKQLAAYRIETEKLHDTTKMLADVSSGLGVDMNRLILAYGQVKAANYLRGTELRQFSEAGVNLLKDLADYFTAVEGRAVSVAQVFDRVSKRMVTFEHVDTIIRNMTSEGGQFYKMQEKQSETLKGMLMNFQDSMDLMMNDIGKDHEGTLKTSVSLAKTLVEQWRMIVPFIKGATMALAIYAAKMAWVKLASMALSHPYLLAISAVVGLVYAIYDAYTAQSKLNAEMERINTEATKSLEEHISLYHKLVEVYNDATKSNQERNNALTELQTKFKDILPQQLLEIEYIQQISKGYKEAEDALMDYYNSKAREQKRDYVESQFASELEGTDIPELISSTKDWIEDMFEIGEITAEQKIRLTSGVSGIVHSLVEDVKQGKIAAEFYTLQNVFKKRLEVFSEVDLDNLWNKGYWGHDGRRKNIADVIITLRKYRNALEGIEGLSYETYDQVVADELIEKEKKNVEIATDAFKKAAALYNQYVNAIPTATKSIQQQRKEIEEDVQQIITNLPVGMAKYAEHLKAIFGQMKSSADEGAFAFQSVLQSLESQLYATEDEKGAITGGFAKIALDNVILNESANDAAKQMVETFKKGLSEKSKNLKMTDFQNAVIEGAASIADRFGQSTEIFQSFVPKYGETLDTIRKEVESTIEGIETRVKELNQSLTQGLGVLSWQALGEKEEELRQLEQQLPALRAFSTFLGSIPKKTKGSAGKDWFAEMGKAIRDTHKDFLTLHKDLDRTRALELAMEKHSDVFAEAAKGAKMAGLSLSDFSSLLVEDNAINALESLLGRIPESAAKSRLAIEKMIGELKGGEEVRAAQERYEELNNQIEKLFGTYELSLELKDINIPTDLAEKLFNFESIDLSELRQKVLDELGVVNREGTDAEIIERLKKGDASEERIKLTEDTLKKIADMEAKALEERMQKYAKFLEQEQTERVKIKLNEVRQLMEIEDAFRIHKKDAREKFGMTNDQWELYEEQRKKGEEINLEFLKGLGIEEEKAQAILEQNRLLTEQAQIARAGVMRVTQEDLDKNAWEEFKKSSYYETLFADMEHSGTKSLRNLRDKIGDMKKSLKNLPPEIYKQVVEAIEKIENELDNRNPLGALFGAWKELRDLSKKGVTIKTADKDNINVKSRDNIAERLKLENKNLEKNREEIALRKQFLHANEQIRRQLLEENKTLRDGLDAHRNIDDVLSEQITKLEEECEIYEENIKLLATEEGRYRMIEARAKNAQKGIQEWANATNDLIGSVDSLLDAFGLAEDSQARIWMKASMGIVDTIASVAQLIIQFTIMEVAANSALGIIGYIAMALKAIATLFVTLFGNPDEELQKQIEELEVRVESLDRKFQKLEKSIKNAMGVDDINRFTDDAIRNLKEQNEALGEMIATEEAKKGTDADRIRDWANEMEDNIEEIERLRNNRIKELGGIGGAEDIKSAAEEFTDAWLQAFLETGDGLVGLEDKFNDFARNLIKSQLMHRVVESLIRPLTTKINEIVDPQNEGGGDVTDKEWQELMLLWDRQKEVINDRLTSLVEELGGLDSLSSNRDLEGLQKGVQSIQESTAQEIVSYMNSLRALVTQRETFYKNNEQLSSIMNSILVDGINPMLDQLRVIANNTESIHTLLDSVVRAGHSQGGYGIKVFSD